MFRNRVLSRWVGFLCGLPVFLSVSAYRAGHLPHHKHERDEHDPDELENFSTKPRTLAMIFCLVFVAGELFGFHRVGLANAFRGPAENRLNIAVEYSIIAAAFAAAVLFVPGGILLHGWLFPVLFGKQLTNVRTLAEHVLTSHDNRILRTRTVVSNRFVSFFMCNLNYHIEHHLFPAIPWYNLPRVHALLSDEFRRCGAQVYTSYLRFLGDLSRFVWRALRPGGNRLPLELRAPAWRATTSHAPPPVASS
jgi:fatty acid desaturase